MVSGRLEGSLGAGATPQNDDDIESQRSISPPLTQASGRQNRPRARKKKQKEKLLKPKVSENHSQPVSQTSSQSHAPDDPNPVDPKTSTSPSINPKRPISRRKLVPGSCITISH
ncbi:hypothetical protein FRC03_012590 [Tulasnella sp. 419]|nr:hypothetical protein FRC03_012590 [Tulasnella sp. 419]